MKEFIIFILGLIIIYVIEFYQMKGYSIRNTILSKPVVLRYALMLALMFSILIFGAYGEGYQPLDPIYGGF